MAALSGTVSLLVAIRRRHRPGKRLAKERGLDVDYREAVETSTPQPGAGLKSAEIRDRLRRSMPTVHGRSRTCAGAVQESEEFKRIVESVLSEALLLAIGGLSQGRRHPQGAFPSASASAVTTAMPGARSIGVVVKAQAPRKRVGFSISRPRLHCGSANMHSKPPTAGFCRGAAAAVFLAITAITLIGGCGEDRPSKIVAQADRSKQGATAELLLDEVVASSKNHVANKETNARHSLELALQSVLEHNAESGWAELRAALEQTRAVAALRGDGSMITALAVSPTGDRVALGTLRGNLTVWSSSGERLMSLQARGGTVGAIAFAHDGNSLAFGDRSGRVSVVEGQSDVRVYDSIHNGYVTRIEYIPSSGKWVSVSVDGTMCVWIESKDSGLIVSSMNHAVHGCLAVVTGPEGQFLVTSGALGGYIRRWTDDGLEESGKLVLPVGFDAEVQVLRDARDGGSLVVGAQRGNLYMLESWEGSGRFRDLGVGTSYAVAVSSDGSLMCTVDGLGAVAVFGSSGDVRESWHGGGESPRGIARVCFVESDRRIASLSLNKVLQVWTLNGELIAELSAFLPPAEILPVAPFHELLELPGQRSVVVLNGGAAAWIWRVGERNEQDLLALKSMSNDELTLRAKRALYRE